MPIASMTDRLHVFKETFDRELPFWEGDLKDYSLDRARRSRSSAQRLWSISVSVRRRLTR